jgi:hypothetical protein
VTESTHWNRWFAEAVVIVSSILLAFGIDAWWDRRGEEAAERELLDVICQDVANDRASIARYMEANEAHSLARRSFLEASPDELVNLSVAEASLDGLQAIAIFQPGPSTARTTNLSSLGDRRVREVLGNWRMRLADFEENASLHWNSLLELQRAGGAAFMASRVGDELQWDIPEGSVPIPTLLRNLRADQEFVGAELRLQLLIGYTMTKAGRVVETSDELLDEFCLAR